MAESMTPNVASLRAAADRIAAAYPADLTGIVRSQMRAMKNDVEAPPNTAAKSIRDATRSALIDFARSLALPESEEAASGLSAEGLSWLDDRFSAFLVARFRTVGAEAARHARADWAGLHDAARPFSAWVDPLSSRVRLLVAIVWRAELAARPASFAPVRVPTAVSLGLAHARAHGGRLHGESIFVEPARGEPLTFDFSGERPTLRCLGAKSAPPVVGLRQALRASTIHTWLALLNIYQDSGMRPDGLFTFDGPSSVLDVIAARQVTETRQGRVYPRYHAAKLSKIADDLILLSRVRARVVGDLEQVGADALVSEIRDRRHGRTVTFAHSRLVVTQLRKSYFQIPRAVCSLETADVPIALGIATVAREGMLESLRAEARGRKGRTATACEATAITAPISEWLDVAGIDELGERRKQGPTSFYPACVDRLARIAEEGMLGALTACGGGGDAVLTLTVDAALRGSYAPLLEAARRRARDGRPARSLPGQR